MSFRARAEVYSSGSSGIQRGPLIVNCLSRLFFPVTRVTQETATLNESASNLRACAFALPSTGGAVSPSFSRPFSAGPISRRLLRVWTRTARRKTSPSHWPNGRAGRFSMGCLQKPVKRPAIQTGQNTSRWQHDHNCLNGNNRK